MIRVGILSAPLTATGTGSGTYLRYLVQGFKKYTYSDDFEFVLLRTKNQKDIGLASLYGFPEKVIPNLPLVRNMWLNGAFDVVIQGGVGIFSPTFFTDTKVISLIYGGWELVSGERTSSYYRKRYLRPVLLHYSNRIVTISQSSKDIIARFNDEKKVDVVYCGIDTDIFVPKPQTDFVVNDFRIHGPYILHTSRLTPRKNPKLILASFEQLTSKYGFQNLKLVIAGKGWKEYLATRPTNPNIIALGYVSQDALIALYSSCTAFWFLSQYEGFGLPVLEAMACGAPTVISNQYALAEIGEGSSILIDIDKASAAESVASATAQLMSDSEYRRCLSDAGLQRAKEFDMSKMIHKFLDIIVNVSDENR